jgi:hypothetical protein
MAPKKAPKPKPKARGLRPTPAVAKPAPQLAEQPPADPNAGDGDPAQPEDPLSPIRTQSNLSTKSTKSAASDTKVDMDEDFEPEEDEEDEDDDEDKDDDGEVEDMGIEEHLIMQRRMDEFVESPRHFVKFQEIEVENTLKYGQTRPLDPTRVQGYKANMATNPKANELDDLLLWHKPGMRQLVRTCPTPCTHTAVEQPQHTLPPFLCRRRPVRATWRAAHHLGLPGDHTGNGSFNAPNSGAMGEAPTSPEVAGRVRPHPSGGHALGYPPLRSHATQQAHPQHRQ